MNTTSKLYQELKDKKEYLLKSLKDKEDRMNRDLLQQQQSTMNDDYDLD